MKTITKTTTTNLSFEDIEYIIDEHLSDETNLFFVCDKKLAERICDYVLNEYDLMDEDMELDDNVKECYVSFYFDEDGVNFFCETAFGISGEYKMHDIEDEYTDFYICVDMDTKVVFDKLLGEEGSWNWVRVELGEEEVKEEENPFEYNNDECEDCSECKEIDLEEKLKNDGLEYDELLDLYTEKIQNTHFCPGCIREVLDEFGSIFISDIDNCYDEEDDCEYKEESEEELVCDDNCEECNTSIETCRDIHIVEKIASEFEDSKCQCEVCLRNMIYKALMIGKDIGWHDHKQVLLEVLSEDD